MKQFLAILAITCFLVHSTQSAEVIVFGDSWGTYGRKSFEQVMSKHGLTVDNVAIGGTTSEDWAKDKYALKETVDANPDAKYVWLTIGGNDCTPKMIANWDIDEIRRVVKADTKVFLDVLFEAHPNIKVVQFGYDLFDFTNNNLLCSALGREMF